MSQVDDYSLGNLSFPAARARINALLAAIRASNAGPTAPTNPAAGMTWLDTSVSPAVLRQRSGDNTTWLQLSTPFPVPIDLGGTGATTAAAARAALGATAASDLPPALTQGQVQNAGDTTQGTVSGQLLAQASQSLANGAAGWPKMTPAALDRMYVQSGEGLGQGNQISLGWDGVGFIATVDGSFRGTVHTSSMSWAFVGTYAILHNRVGVLSIDSLCPGSQLFRSASSFAGPIIGSIPASNVNFGTWRAMTAVPAATIHNPPDSQANMFPGLFLRVS